MHKLEPDRGSSNVNVTLDPAVDGFGGLEFPCPFCGAGLAILLTKRNKPYCTCNPCGVQIFVRGKNGIKRLRKMVNEGVLISATNESASQGINLLNRLEQLKTQRNALEAKQGIFFRDENVANAIQLLDTEIQKVEGELAKMAAETKRDTEK